MNLEQALDGLLGICVLLAQEIVGQFAVKDEEVHEVLAHEAAKLQRRPKAGFLSGAERRSVFDASRIEVKLHLHSQPLVIQGQPQGEGSRRVRAAFLSELADSACFPASFGSRAGERRAQQRQRGRLTCSVWHLDEGYRVGLATCVTTIHFMVRTPKTFRYPAENTQNSRHQLCSPFVSSRRSSREKAGLRRIPEACVSSYRSSR